MNRIVDCLNVLSGDAHRLELDNGILVSDKVIEAKKGMPYMSPGLVDVQVNGNLGMDYSSPDLSVDDVIQICESLAEKGTLQHFPTIVTRPENLINRNLGVIAQAVEKSSIAASEITGIHVEGPFISSVDGPRGAHDANFVRKPSIVELDSWIEYSRGLLRIVTIAPEVESAEKFIRYATRKGIVCSIGHSQASGDQIDAAVRSGARACTHLGNGSAAMLDRLNNHIIAQLANDNLAITIISDGSHVPPRAVKVFSKCRDENNIVIITDLAPMAGLPKGIMDWGYMKVEIVEDGSVRLAGTPYLAGAGSPLIRNIGNYVRFTGKSLRAAVCACTLNPTRIYGLDPQRMELVVGKKAEFILFNWDEESSVTRIEQSFSRLNI